MCKFSCFISNIAKPHWYFQCGGTLVRIMKKLILFLSFIGGITTTFGQNVLTGQIKNSQGIGVEYVSIGIEGDTIGTISDINGFYTLNIPE